MWHGSVPFFCQRLASWVENVEVGQVPSTCLIQQYANQVLKEVAVHVSATGAPRSDTWGGPLAYLTLQQACFTDLTQLSCIFPGAWALGDG